MNWNEEIAVRAYLTNFGRTIDAQITKLDNKQHKVFLGTLAFAEIDPMVDSAWSAPTTRFSKDAAQELMDALWRCGCRPTEAAGSAGQLSAVQAHLNDMRALVFDKDKS